MYTFGVYLVYHTHMYDILTLSKAALCDTSKEVELSGQLLVTHPGRKNCSKTCLCSAACVHACW